MCNNNYKDLENNLNIPHQPHMTVNHRVPFVKIVEQPTARGYRFRYSSDRIYYLGGENRGTHPSIKVVGYNGPILVAVSCVTKDQPFRQHPNRVTRGAKSDNTAGVYIYEKWSFSGETHTFTDMVIECPTRKNIAISLLERQRVNVDPFQTGFDHIFQEKQLFDLNALRLCIQVFLKDESNGSLHPLAPIVTNIIYNRKAQPDLKIVKLSHTECPADGGNNDIIVLCQKVSKDIQIRFFEVELLTDSIVWESIISKFPPSQLHHPGALWFRPPKYRNLKIQQPVQVFMQLTRKSDDSISEIVPFVYLPLMQNFDSRKRKEKRISNAEGILENAAKVQGIHNNFAPIVASQIPKEEGVSMKVEEQPNKDDDIFGLEKQQLLSLEMNTDEIIKCADEALHNSSSKSL